MPVGFKFDQFANFTATGGQFDWLNDDIRMSLYQSPLEPVESMVYSDVLPYLLSTATPVDKVVDDQGRCYSSPVEFRSVNTSEGELCMGTIIWRPIDNMLLVHMQEGYDMFDGSVPFNRPLENEDVILRPNGLFNSAWFRP